MKTCSYCGRENEPGLIHCRECGTTLPDQEDIPKRKPLSAIPPPLPKQTTAMDPSAITRSCRCGGSMHFYRPLGSYMKSGVFSAFEMVYRCSDCRREAIIPTAAIMIVCAMGTIAFTWVFLSLLFGGALTAMTTKSLKSLLVIIACPLFLFVCLYLFLCGVINRLRFPPKLSRH